MNDIAQIVSEILRYQSPIIVLILMVWFSLLYFFKDSLNSLIKSIKFSKSRKCKELIYHDFFITLSSILHKVDHIEFVTHGEPDIAKNKILHHIVQEKIKSLESHILTLLKNPKTDLLDSQEMKFELSSVFHKSSRESNVIVNSDFKDWGLTERDIKAVIDGCEEFMELLTEGLMDRVDSIAANNDYHSNHDKMSAVLEVMAMSYFMMPRMVKDVFDKMNGRFAKYNKDYGIS